jgi:hypothetical protein
MKFAEEMSVHNQVCFHEVDSGFSHTRMPQQLNLSPRNFSASKIPLFPTKFGEAFLMILIFPATTSVKVTQLLASKTKVYARNVSLES